MPFQDESGATLFEINGDGWISTRTNTLDREFAPVHELLVEATDNGGNVGTGKRQTNSWL